MNQILPPMKEASAICGKQKPREGEALRPVRHRIAVPCGNGSLLFHTLTGELVYLSRRDAVSEEVMNCLSESWFLVPEDFDERTFVDKAQNIARLIAPFSRGKNSFMILTTTDCNARCFYCYELGVRRIPMSSETARAAAEYIARACAGKPVKLRWFGGEPLYNREAINIVCGILQKTGVEYESSMVSNGYYLDEDTVRTAVYSWHLKKVQITVDGTEEVYNRTKAYIEADENPYLRVMDNIHHALEAGIQVTLRLNMDAGNAEDLLSLADDLATRFPTDSKPDVYVAMLHEFTGMIQEHETKEKAIDAWQAIRNKLKGYGLLKEISLPRKLRQSRCMADSESSETILPDGRTGRCEHYSEGMITGSLQKNQRDEEVIKAWKEPLTVPECGECVLYPICRKLKKCEWNKNGCTEIEREMELIELKEQMLAEYIRYMEEKGHETQE